MKLVPYALLAIELMPYIYFTMLMLSLLLFASLLAVAFYALHTKIINLTFRVMQLELILTQASK